MNLDDTQKKTVAEWIAQGAKLSEIQTRLAAEFGVKLTYMETRFLLDDLKFTPKDAEPAKPLTPIGATTAANPATTPLNTGAKPTNGVSVTVDEITRPGSIVSGKVTFSDGQAAEWYLDQTGRLGLVPKQTGYRPSAADVQQFQMTLQSELAKLGF